MSMHRMIQILLRRGVALLLALVIWLEFPVNAYAWYTNAVDIPQQTESGTAGGNNYQDLAASGTKAADAEGTLTDDCQEWVDKWKDKVVKSGVKTATSTMQKAFAAGAKSYAKEGNQEIADHMSEVASSFAYLGLGYKIKSLIDLGKNVLNLQGETLEDQIAELAFLTAKFAIAGFSCIGIGLSFPWGLLVGFLLDLILDLIRKGVFHDLFSSFHWGSNSEVNQRYKLPEGTNVYKPNIYLYSDEERTVTVAFGAPWLLTTTIPDYTDSWDVTVHTDGTMTDASGTRYDYLFYESLTDPSMFQTGAGWRIPADTREETLREILTSLHFNEQEMTDFLEFWTAKLDPGKDYIMYPQGTDLVDRAMPIGITDAPESVERIWFAFAQDDGQELAEPAGYELQRGGDAAAWYVVEWGGFFLDGDGE